MSKEHKNHSKTTVRPCNRLLLPVLFGSLRLYYYLRGVRVKKTVACDGQPKGPAIVLCNHGSFIDFIYAGCLVYQSRPHFIVARLYFYHKILGWMLRQMGCFPKSMFALDMESTKNCLRVLQNGEILAMMPEARLSTDGRFEDIQPGTFSFLKKCGVPIYTICISGDYLANPKWGKGPRRGALVEAKMELLYTAEQVAQMRVEEIRAGVEQRLRYDEFAWLQTRPRVRYRNARLAEGLENILMLCPQCGRKHSLSTRKNAIFCSHCGKLTTMGQRYDFQPDFVFEHLGQWYDHQLSQLRQEILVDPAYTLESKVELRLPSDGKGLTRHGGFGHCVLDRQGLRYVGTRDGQEISQSFSLKQIYRLLFGAGENFEVYQGSEIWYFVPENKQTAIQWYLTSKILYDEILGEEGSVSVHN